MQCVFDGHCDLSNDLNECTFIDRRIMLSVSLCSAGLNITPSPDYLLTQRAKAALCLIIAFYIVREESGRWILLCVCVSYSASGLKPLSPCVDLIKEPQMRPP